MQKSTDGEKETAIDGYARWNRNRPIEENKASRKLGELPNLLFCVHKIMETMRWLKR